MAEYDLRPELMSMQQSLLEEYECQLNQEIEGNMVIWATSYTGSRMEKRCHTEKSSRPFRERKNWSKLVALKNFNEELLSVAEEQHQYQSLSAPTWKVRQRSMRWKDLRQQLPQQKWPTATCCFVEKNSFWYCARQSQCEKRSSSLSS